LPEDGGGREDAFFAAAAVAVVLVVVVIIRLARERFQVAYIFYSRCPPPPPSSTPREIEFLRTIENTNFSLIKSSIFSQHHIKNITSKTSQQKNTHSLVCVSRI